MIDRINFNTTAAPRMSDVFPQAVITGDYIFVSGTAGLLKETGRIISHDFEEQARQCFANIKAVVEEAGSSLSNIVKTTIFMVAGNDFSVLNKVYAEVFPHDPPARSVPQVHPFPAGILVSVECIAVTSRRRTLL